MGETGGGTFKHNVTEIIEGVTAGARVEVVGFCCGLLRDLRDMELTSEIEERGNKGSFEKLSTCTPSA